MIRGDELIVIAVAADKRAPGYWRDRIDDESGQTR